MLRWRIFKAGNIEDSIIIYAESFDEAIKKARLRDPNYHGGYVEDDDE